MNIDWTEIGKFALAHWKLLLLIYLGSCVVSGMPTPTNNGGVTGTWYYKWLYATSHFAFGNLFRLLIPLMPVLPAWLQNGLKPFIGQGSSPAPGDKP